MSRTRCRIGLIVGSCLLAVAACSGGSGDSAGDATGGTLLDASGISMRAAARHVSYADTTAAVRDLGSQMVRSANDDDGNIVVSPTSLALALALMREGAGPLAAAEIDGLLGSSADRRQVYNAMLHDFAGVGEGSELDVADAAFLDEDYAPEVSPKYLAAIKTWYGAGLHSTDFGTSRGADDLNAWVDQQTHGRIPSLVDELDPTTALVVINAMYLKASWVYQFDEDKTEDADFLTGSGSVVKVAMMRHDGVEGRYESGSGWQAVSVPYEGGELDMWLLLPTEPHVDPVQLLTPETLTQLSHSSYQVSYDLGLPRWDTSSEGSLRQMLRSLGMRESFEPGAFSGIADDPALTLADVIQKANVTVTEKGTVGAAATAAEFFVSGPPQNIGTFIVNHPFAFAIVHEPTGMPLFEGVVVDPS